MYSYKLQLASTSQLSPFIPCTTFQPFNPNKIGPDCPHPATASTRLLPPKKQTDGHPQKKHKRGLGQCFSFSKKGEGTTDRCLRTYFSGSGRSFSGVSYVSFFLSKPLKEILQLWWQGRRDSEKMTVKVIEAQFGAMQKKTITGTSKRAPTGAAGDFVGTNGICA